MLESDFGLPKEGKAVLVSIQNQKMYLIDHGTLDRIFPVSTSKHGIGSIENSHKTPSGTHKISSRIGEGSQIGTIFKGRINTGEVAEIITDPGSDNTEDHVTTRILVLEGLEEGINKGSGIDTLERHIYIHGTPEEGLIGRNTSSGCIRMKNEDIIELFNLVEENTLVHIQP